MKKPCADFDIGATDPPEYPVSNIGLIAIPFY